MKKIISEIKFSFVGITSFIGCCYLLGEIQNWFMNFIEGKELLLIIGLPIIMFLVFLILSIKSK